MAGPAHCLAALGARRETPAPGRGLHSAAWRLVRCQRLSWLPWLLPESGGFVTVPDKVRRLFLMGSSNHDFPELESMDLTLSPPLLKPGTQGWGQGFSVEAAAAGVRLLALALLLGREAGCPSSRAGPPRPSAAWGLSAGFAGGACSSPPLPSRPSPPSSTVSNRVDPFKVPLLFLLTWRAAGKSGSEVTAGESGCR